MSIIEQNQKQGLVLQPSNTEKADFICSCCGCCCGMLDVHKNIPKPLDFWASNFQAVVDTNTCEGCGTCEEWCQVGAVSVSESKQQAGGGSEPMSWMRRLCLQLPDRIHIPCEKAYRSKTATNAGRSLRNHNGQEERSAGEIKADRKNVYRCCPNRAD